MRLPLIFLTLLAWLGMASAYPGPASIPAQRSNKADSSFWYANMDHTGDARGLAPNAPNDDSYAVYQAVTAGDGGSIQNAIDSASSSGSRESLWLVSQPRVLKAPPLPN